VAEELSIFVVCN